MSVSIFDEKKIVPTEAMLSEELGSSITFLNELKLFIQNEFGDVTPEWKHYGQKSGWILKLFNKKRNVLFIIPLKEFFQVVFTFGDKAVDAILASALPEKVKLETAAAKKYSEGRSIRLDVKNSTDLKVVLELVRIKLEN